MVNALNEATNELKKHLSSKRFPCVYVLQGKTERIKFWNDAIDKLSNIPTN